MSENAITKSEIIRRVAARFPNAFIKDVNQVVDVVFQQIASSLCSGKRVEIRGFGAFTIRKRKPRVARNPRTNEPVTLSDRFVPYFRAGKEIKDRLNSNDNEAA